MGAAVSGIGPADLAPDLTRVRAYERVVNSCHRQGTVIPLRYGSVVSKETQVIELLDEYNPQYESLLQELEGCVEMGLRILLPAASPGLPPGSREVAGPPPPAPPEPPERLGLTYLTARKAHYAHQDRWTEEYRQVCGPLPGPVCGTVRQIQDGSAIAPSPFAFSLFPDTPPGGGGFSPGLPATYRDRVSPAAALRPLAAL